jgi:hypothetical protein
MSKPVEPGAEVKSTPATRVKIFPAVALVPFSTTLKLLTATTTEKLLLDPVALPPVRVAVITELPVLEMVTEVVRTPLTKFAVVPPPDENVHPLQERSTVPVKLLTVLPAEFFAVIVIEKEVPCVCCVMVLMAKLATLLPTAKLLKAVMAFACTPVLVAVALSVGRVQVQVGLQLSALATT